MRKFFRLTNQALEVLKTPEVKLQLMLFFEVTDARTIESYLKENVPKGPLMNICGRDLILEYDPLLKERDLYHRMTDAEKDGNTGWWCWWQHTRKSVQQNNSFIRNKTKKQEMLVF